jgi:hypothetical protein
VSSSSPYRNEIDALRERKASLETEIARLRAQTSQLDALRTQEQMLAGELCDVEKKLGANASRRSLPLLDQVKVASPCDRDWNEMLGDDRVRFCLGCEKNVFNLSAMKREEAEALLRERLGNDLCVRFYQRTDGTILTEDCPVGVKKKRRKKIALAVAGAGAMALAAATLMAKQTCTRRMGGISYQQQQGQAIDPGDDRVMMGEPAVIDPPSTTPVVPVMGSMATPTPPPPPPHVKMGRRAK